MPGRTAGLWVHVAVALLGAQQWRLAGAQRSRGAFCEDTPNFMISLTAVDAADGDPLPVEHLGCGKIQLGGHCATAWIANGCKRTCDVCSDEDQPPAEKLEPADHYRVLGLGASADAKAIKKAYRQLAKKYHPDKSTVPHAGKTQARVPPVCSLSVGRACHVVLDIFVHAERAFARIGDAYETLSDPRKRRSYDKINWPQETRRPPPPRSFNELLRAAARANNGNRSRGADGVEFGVYFIIMVVAWVVEYVRDWCSKKPGEKRNSRMTSTRPKPSRYVYTPPTEEQVKSAAMEAEVEGLKKRAKKAGVDKFLLADTIDSPGFRAERGFEPQDIAGALLALIEEAEQKPHRKSKSKGRRSPSPSPTRKPRRTGRNHSPSPAWKPAWWWW